MEGERRVGQHHERRWFLGGETDKAELQGPRARWQGEGVTTLRVGYGADGGIRNGNDGAGQRQSGLGIGDVAADLARLGVCAKGNQQHEEQQSAFHISDTRRKESRWPVSIAPSSC